jgi:catechol 2,3-dioxygenase-like lactoylglutathione lyase family enzyme
MIDHVMLHVSDYDRSSAFVTDFDGNNVEVVCHKPE